MPQASDTHMFSDLTYNVYNLRPLSKVKFAYILFGGLMIITHVCLTFVHLYLLSTIEHVLHGIVL